MLEGGTPRSASPSSSVLAAHLDGESVLLELKGKRYFRLNETGQVIWRALEAGLPAEAAVAQLVRDFAVDGETARTEVERFMAELASRGLLEPRSGP